MVGAGSMRFGFDGAILRPRGVRIETGLDDCGPCEMNKGLLKLGRSGVCRSLLQAASGLLELTDLAPSIRLKIPKNKNLMLRLGFLLLSYPHCIEQQPFDKYFLNE